MKNYLFLLLTFMAFSSGYVSAEEPEAAAATTEASAEGDAGAATDAAATEEDAAKAE